MTGMMEPLPALTGLAESAAECWRWCGGWHPERWPIFAALHEVQDWAAMSDLMLTIRLAHEKEQENERTATITKRK
jgi:hypothetical protein